jgi:exopolysaccharide production protein ExoZ
MTVRPRLFPWVQGLRALAAAAVAFVHIANDAVTTGRDPGGWIEAAAHAMPWAAGVDIFFVISGFVIVHASAALFARKGGVTLFLRRRLTRIVPLYWALTTLFLAMAMLQRSAIRGETGGAGYLVASYLFVPWPRPDGVMEPALGLGWTLNYEMFFYLVLSAFLVLRRTPAVLGAAASLCLLVAAGQTVGLAAPVLRFWSDPMILEFVFGMGIALVVAQGLRLPGWLRLTIIAVAVAALHAQADMALSVRPLSLGLPGALLVIAAVSVRRPEQMRAGTRLLVRLGDASYAMYLFHPFVMRAFTLLGARIDAHSEASGIAIAISSLVVAQLCALAINAGFERKLTKVLRRRSRAVQP